MAKGDIRLSKKHGVNPMLVVCFFCNEESGEIALLGALPGDAEAPRRGVLNHEPCSKCKGYMKQGVILISVDEKKSKSDLQNPYRTGGWVVVKEEAVKRMVNEPTLRDAVLRQRVCFLPDDAWEKMGLPMEHVRKAAV
jgi:hypothetical protein